MNKKFLTKLDTCKRPFLLICVVILVICALIVILYKTNPSILNGEDDEDPGVAVGCYPPSVYVNDTRYGVSPMGTYFTEFDESFVYLGEVKECVGPQNVPQKNFQANHDPVGTKIYRYGEDLVLLMMNGNYSLYERD